MGQKTLDDSRLISKQPYLVVCLNHKMQEHGHDQNEDIKFKIKSCFVYNIYNRTVTVVH